MRTDLRDALRSLRASRGTTLLAFAILTAAMAAAIVTFSVVDAVAIEPLPFKSPDQLVAISLPTATPGRTLPASPHDYFTWVEGTRSFEGLAAARGAAPVRLETDGLPETLGARRVTANLFEVLGVLPAAGRFFGAAHGRPGGPNSVILSHALWVRKFGADPSVIGRRLDLGQTAAEVIGVLPPGVGYPVSASMPPDIYLPYVVTASERSNNRGFSMFVVGRLRAGVTIEQARADVERSSSALVNSLHDQVVGPAKTWLLLVLLGVAFVLLVACVNVASLLLARGASRSRELATRQALGASRGRLVCQLVLEGLVLSLASVAAGLLFSIWGLEIARSILPPGLARVAGIAVDTRVLVTAVSAAILIGVGFGSAPAWMAFQSDVSTLMKAGGGQIIGGRRRDRMLSSFLVADIAFVSVLLVATTLIVTSFVLVTRADLGFDRNNVMMIWYQRSLGDLPKSGRPAAAVALRAELLGRVRSVPGVTHAAIANQAPPLSGGQSRDSIIVPNYGETVGDAMPETRAVTPDYFQAMGMRLVRGRLFDSSDGHGAPRVMLINDIAARQYFADRDPLGQVVTFGGPVTVIGILQAVRFNGPEVELRPEVFIPLDQQPYVDWNVQEVGGSATFGALVVRTNADARGVAIAVRNAIRPAVSRDPNPTEFVEDYFRRLTAVRRFNAEFMTTFGIIAIAIGVLGVYGTMTFLVARQARAIGVRMALGATPRRILRDVLGKALRRVWLGTALGLAGAWIVSRALTAFVFGIQPTDVWAYAGVGAFLSVVGIAAAFVPAHRAARLDPLVALRHD